MEQRQEPECCRGEVTLETARPWTLWQTEVERRSGAQVARRAVRWRAWASIRGLRSPAARKNGWQIAEINGERHPYGVHQLLGRAIWDADAVRDALRPYVVEHLGSPEAVLVVDETGFLKKGPQSAGVARQYRGTAGRVEHCPMGVFLAYASPQGHLLLDRERYLPHEWASDKARCAAAGTPEERPFATKPPWAPQMLQRALDKRVPAAWVTGASVSGDKRSLRRWLEVQAHAHVMAVSGKASVWGAGRQPQGKTLLAALGTEGWCRLSAGVGAKGPRWYDWQWRARARPLHPAWRRGLLVRRSLHDPSALTA